MNWSRSSLYWGLVLSVLALCPAVHAEVSGLKILGRFGKNPGGFYPESPLVQAADGVFYGTTPMGGSHANGTVFSLSPAGVLTTLYDFSALDGHGRNRDGANPGALILGRDGNLFGTTASAGPGGFGTIFRLTPAGALTTLYTCAGPCENLFQGSDGNLYGVLTTVADNTQEVFRMTPDGALTTVSAVDRGPRGNRSVLNLIQGSDGNFYGTTIDGGDNSMFFQLTPAGALTILAKFRDAFGGLLQGTDGDFYFLAGGDTFTVPPIPYVLDRITPAGKLTTIHRFSPLLAPVPALIQGRDGNFYGESSGLSADERYSGGIYRITPSGVLTTLSSFGGYPQASNPEGGLIQGSDGNFYGTSNLGGKANVGTIFSLTPDGQFTLMHSFGFGNGQGPDGALVQGKDGSIYGMTQGEHYENQNGSIFKIAPTGALTPLHTFILPDGGGPNSDGADPLVLVAGVDGNLYGITEEGGANGSGTFFRITPAGVLTTLFSFASADVLFDLTLIAGTDGNFYGTSGGTIFSFSPTGDLKILYSSGRLHQPDDLIQGSDGNFYGTTDYPTIFRLTPAGVFTVLDDGIAEKGQPQGLIQGGDGNFYGTLSAGGTQGDGAIFSLTPAGVLTTLYSFTGGIDGGNPSSLIQGSDGNFYGTTSNSLQEENGQAGIFQLTPTGILNSLYAFTASEGPAIGSFPVGAPTLLQGSDGNFYGTTPGAGADGKDGTFEAYGTVFELPFAAVANSPLINSADTPIAAVGRPFTYRVTANHHPTSYAASGLPAGLTIDSATGLISGMASQVGAFGVSLVAQTDAGTAKATLNLNVVPLATLAATTPSVLPGATGVFVVTLSAPAFDEVVVNYTVAGDAINGTDYKLLKGTVKFNPGQTSAPINVVPKGDLEGAAKKAVKLTLASGNSYLAGTTTAVKIELLGADR